MAAGADSMSNDKDSVESCSVEVAPDPFCLQPTDPFTLSLMRVWVVTAACMKVNPDKIAKAEQHYKEIQQWQKKYGTRLPD